MNDERALLSAMLVFNDCIPKVSQFVTAEDFLEENHRRIFNAFVMHYADGIPVELPALGKALKQKNDMAYIAELLDIATTGETAPYYARQVKDAARLRRITHLAQELAAKPDDKGLAELLTTALIAPKLYHDVHKSVLENLTRFSELSAEEYIIEWILDVQRW